MLAATVEEMERCGKYGGVAAAVAAATPPYLPQRSISSTVAASSSIG
jgi:hypothetical protein